MCVESVKSSSDVPRDTCAQVHQSRPVEVDQAGAVPYIRQRARPPAQAWEARDSVLGLYRSGIRSTHGLQVTHGELCCHRGSGACALHVLKAADCVQIEHRGEIGAGTCNHTDRELEQNVQPYRWRFFLA